MSASDLCEGDGSDGGSVRDRSWKPGLRMWFAMENDLTVTSRTGALDSLSLLGSVIGW